MIQSTKQILLHQNQLQKLIEGEAAFDEKTRAIYATAACMYKIVPTGVVFPKSLNDVIQVVNYARQNGLSITARGAGSSLVGQAVNNGVILDFTRYMNKIIAYDAEKETVRLQPGVTQGELNRFLKKYDRYLPPDPSSGEYCTLGGMIANNATGSHSIKCGATVDYIESLQVVLFNGSSIETRIWDVNKAQFKNFINQQTDEAKLYRFIYELVNNNKALIENHTPKVEKNASGYRLEKLIDGNRFNLGKLFCSSEGTLGIVTEIELQVKKPPRHKILTVINFDTLEKAAQAIELILDINPSAVEMMEKKAIRLVRKYRPDLHDYFPENIESQLFVEFDGWSLKEVQGQNNQLVQFLKNTFAEGVEFKIAADAAERNALWQIRKESFPLVYNEKRPEKVLAFIEDYAVKPKDIAEYIRKLYDIYKKYEVDAIIYGHAGRGNFHTRPFINLKEESQVQKMQKIADEVFEVVSGLGGALSGEHGDGRARAHFLPKIAGPLFELYVRTKQHLDPDGIFNPGVKINKENQLTSNLRFTPDYKRIERETLLHFDDDNYYYEIEKCHGCSACRQMNIATAMCPLFQITGDELASPRGKANILQNLISGNLDSSHASDKQFKQMLDYCIYCESCFVECTSHVDVGKLLLEHKARYRKEHGADLLHWTLEHGEWLSKFTSYFAPVSNPVMKNKAARWLMEKIIGIDRRRTMPKAVTPLKYKNDSKTNGVRNPAAKVVYFSDLYARYNDSGLAKTAVKILEYNQVEVVTPNLHSAAMPAIVYGNFDFARKTIKKNIPVLMEYIRKGYKIVSTEPTAILALKKEWYDLIPSDDTKIISENTFEYFDFLLNLDIPNKIENKPGKVNITFGYHTPCHLAALEIGRPAVQFLRQIPGIKINEINRGCCGIAGTYGFKKGDKGFNQSMKIGAGLFEELSLPEIDLGLSECSTCRMQMEQGSQKRALHPLIVLAYSYGLIEDI